MLPTPTSLKGKRVGVQQGTIQETYAKTYWAPKGVSVVPYPTQDLIYQDMMSGRLDATLQDAIMVDGAFLKQPKGKTSLCWRQCGGCQNIGGRCGYRFT